MKSKAKGFGQLSQMSALNDLTYKLEEETCKLEQDTSTLHKIISSPSGRGEIDAWLGIEPMSEHPDYQAAYDKTQAAQLLASPQDLETLKIMQPVMRDVVKKLSSNPEQFDILETVRSLMEGDKQS